MGERARSELVTSASLRSFRSPFTVKLSHSSRIKTTRRKGCGTGEHGYVSNTRPTAPLPSKFSAEQQRSKIIRDGLFAGVEALYCRKFSESP